MAGRSDGRDGLTAALLSLGDRAPHGRVEAPGEPTDLIAECLELRQGRFGNQIEITVPMLIGGLGLGLCAGSIVLAHISTRTQASVLAVAVWHLTYNMGAATTASRGAVGAVTTACVQVWAVIIVLREVGRVLAQRRTLSAAAT